MFATSSAMSGVSGEFSTRMPNSSAWKRAIIAVSRAMTRRSRCAKWTSSRSPARRPRLLQTMPNASRSRWNSVRPYAGSTRRSALSRWVLKNWRFGRPVSTSCSACRLSSLCSSISSVPSSITVTKWLGWSSAPRSSDAVSEMRAISPPSRTSRCDWRIRSLPPSISDRIDCRSTPTESVCTSSNSSLPVSSAAV